MARSSRNTRRSRSSSAGRDRGAFLFVVLSAALALLVCLTHASEPHLPGDHTDDATASLPVTLDETKLGANLLPISTTSSNSHSDNSVAAVFARLKQQVSAFIGRFVAPTDATCDWSWKQCTCAPSESCKLKPRWGDFHLGHACRLRTSEETKEEEQHGGGKGRVKKWVGAVWGQVKGTTGRTWRKVDRARDRTLHHAMKGFRTAVGKVKAKLPETDKECTFDVVQSVAQRKMVCVPTETCAFQYRAGDVMLNRACRLKQVGAFKTNAEEE